MGQAGRVGGHKECPLVVAAEYEGEEEVRESCQATGVAGQPVSWPKVSHWERANAYENNQFMKTDKELAQQFIDLCDQHEKSWDGEKYALGSLTQFIRENLDQKTAFGRMLGMFANWTNDCFELCKEEVKND